MELQKSICKLADQIRDEDSVDAESQGFGPQKEYVKLINLAYSKNRRGKDIEDRCQEALLNLTTAINSYEQVNNNSY